MITKSDIYSFRLACVVDSYTLENYSGDLHFTIGRVFHEDPDKGKIGYEVILHKTLVPEDHEEGEFDIDHIITFYFDEYEEAEKFVHTTAACVGYVY